MSLAPSCVRHGIALVVGTTGFTEAQLEQLDEVAKEIPLCVAANFSLGVNLLVRLAGEVRHKDFFRPQRPDAYKNTCAQGMFIGLSQYKSQYVSLGRGRSWLWWCDG